MYVPDSYRTSVLLVTLSSYFSLVSSFCPLGQMFAADFFQIPPHDGHPCLSVIRFPLLGLVGDLQPLDNAHAEHTKKRASFQGEPALYI